MGSAHFELTNNAYQLTVLMLDRAVHVRLRDMATNFELADGPYVYTASRASAEGSLIARWLKDVNIEVKENAIEISGSLAGLTLRHVLTLPGDDAIMEERITLLNPTDSLIALENLAVGMQRRISDEVGVIYPELSSDRLVAIPFRHRATDPPQFDWDFRLADLVERPEREQWTDRGPLSWSRFGHVPSTRWASEGWAWVHGEHTFGLYKFNQDGMEFSVLSAEPDEEGLLMRFGGASMASGEPSVLRNIKPGQIVRLGVTRFQTVAGNYEKACYAFRAFLDENGCRFPEGYNPPVHWNELYDNPEWTLGTPGKPAEPRKTRTITYTRDLIEQEAEKARQYSCEALYLDPGWDTDFGTFLWGEEWLGPRREFIDAMRLQYGLKVSLHCPLASWMSMRGTGVSSWPQEACRMDAEGNVVEGAVCLGSKQYLDEAERRLIAHCADGVVFLMFDGNWWNGGCWNPSHGHPVPYTREDHVRANVELARRIHQRYPDVLIEMHDMIAGGRRQRYTPVYYKYGLEGSYDENWGFELWWNPMEAILSGHARSLYYYNLGCNVPVYLHVDLRDDNVHCLVLWWYASTCRHLGIGGTHSNPAIAQAQKLAMKKYRRLERFYKEGEFFGMSEEAHIHLLPDEGAFVVNLFNLSEEVRTIQGSIEIDELGLERHRFYVMPKGGCFDPQTGAFSISRRMEPWSAQVVEVRPLPSTCSRRRP